MDIELWKILVPTFIVVISWAIDSQRNRQAKRRDVVVGHLIEAYRNLEDACVRKPPTEDQKRKFERAIADIQLFGSAEQIKAAKNLVEEFNQGKPNPDPRPVLAAHRNSLRKELGLDSTPDHPGDIIHFRLD